MPARTNEQYPLQYIKGVGPKRAEALAQWNIHTPSDLLRYYPFRYVDATNVTTIKDLRKRTFLSNDRFESVTIVGNISSVRTFPGRMKRVIHTLDDGTGSVTLVWFGMPHFFEKAFDIGETIAVFGTPGEFNGTLQFIHPDFDRIESDDNFLNTGAIVPHYHSGEMLKAVGLDSRGFRRIMRNCVEQFASNEAEIISDDILDRQKIIRLPDALRAIHFPASSDELAQAQYRLKFEEFFFFQLMLARQRRGAQKEPGIAFKVKSDLAKRFVESLPFMLTNAQKKVLREIMADMEKPSPMSRLLQGDVGSGKTVVALLAMLVAVDNGYQAAIMAPTEILSAQHYNTITNYVKELGIKVIELVGGQNKRLRTEILTHIADGSAQIVIGTHALIQEHVEFKNLGFIVIDEQHRFGVMQRAALRQKSYQPDVLVMTATPIPRTLSLTAYGDLDVSIINELPTGRKPIITRVGFESKIKDVWTFIRKQVAAGRQAYIVFPLVEKSETLDYKAAVEEYEKLRTTIFPDIPVGLLHGQQFGYEKSDAMEAFIKGEIKILVTTTVIEVGVDVPNASVMVVMHAERFGLAQLHQLRGRVGRGAEQSYCLLVASDRVQKWMFRETEEKKKEDYAALTRLNTMAATSDGFKIAEVDLELRGPGDFFGTRQSGMPEFAIANIVRDGDILTRARAEAFALTETDPELNEPNHAPVKKYFMEKYSGASALAKA
ncbi:MAG TPA: ATP-dependent DNA helicase RecG [Candidatus Kapabacteria bacterium]|nr:ATP-dependent DNA helicase RecG [Candidatus Kapabacteria bacterium]